MGGITSSVRVESGDDAIANSQASKNADIYINPDNGQLILSNRAVGATEGENNTASLIKTHDLSAAQSAKISQLYSAEFKPEDGNRSFIAEVIMPDGATHKLAGISNRDLHPTGSILNFDLSDYISSATTLRIVAPGVLTSADILKFDEISVSIEQPETLKLIIPASMS